MSLSLILGYICRNRVTRSKGINFFDILNTRHQTASHKCCSNFLLTPDIKKRKEKRRPFSELYLSTQIFH